LKSLADLYPPKNWKGEARSEAPTETASYTTAPTPKASKPEITEPGKTEKPMKGAVEGGRKFINWVVPSHGYCGLPAFYNKNLKQLKRSVPLTIFNPIWQQQAAAYVSEKMAINCGNSEEHCYTGHPTPSKWSQSYAQWARNYQCFMKTLREVYDYGKLADWARVHQDTVDTIMLKHGFCAGLRYDLAI
jgi:hypothetical protein